MEPVIHISKKDKIFGTLKIALIQGNTGTPIPYDDTEIKQALRDEAFARDREDYNLNGKIDAITTELDLQDWRVNGRTVLAQGTAGTNLTLPNFLSNYGKVDIYVDGDTNLNSQLVIGSYTAPIEIPCGDIAIITLDGMSTFTNKALMTVKCYSYDDAWAGGSEELNVMYYGEQVISTTQISDASFVKITGSNATVTVIGYYEKEGDTANTTGFYLDGNGGLHCGVID